jgi:hypothetical protein
MKSWDLVMFVFSASTGKTQTSQDLMTSWNLAEFEFPAKERLLIFFTSNICLIVVIGIFIDQELGGLEASSRSSSLSSPCCSMAVVSSPTLIVGDGTVDVDVDVVGGVADGVAGGVAGGDARGGVASGGVAGGVDRVDAGGDVSGGVPGGDSDSGGGGGGGVAGDIVDTGGSPSSSSFFSSPASSSSPPASSSSSFYSSLLSSCLSVWEPTLVLLPPPPHRSGSGSCRTQLPQFVVGVISRAYHRFGGGSNRPQLSRLFLCLFPTHLCLFLLISFFCFFFLFLIFMVAYASFPVAGCLKVCSFANIRNKNIFKRYL